MIEKLIIFTAAFTFIIFLYLIKDYYDKRKREKLFDSIISSENEQNDIIEVEEEQVIPDDSNEEVFIKLPVDIIKNKLDLKKSEECEDCAKKAEGLGMDMSDICPDLDCQKENVNQKVEKTFDYIRPRDIKSFLSSDKNSINISFYDNTVIRYNISEREFVNKFSKYIKIA